MNKYKWAKRYWFIAVIVALISILFVFIETTYFLFVYGWHFTPINNAELLCDMIGMFGLHVAIFFTGCAVISTVHKILFRSENDNP